jgi:hypothetical protein
MIVSVEAISAEANHQQFHIAVACGDGCMPSCEQICQWRRRIFLPDAFLK